MAGPDRRLETAAELRRLAAELERSVGGSDSLPPPLAAAASPSAASKVAVDDDRRRPLHEKVFAARESVLSAMLTDHSFRAIYHMMIAGLLWLGIRIVLTDWNQRGILVDFGLLTWAFGGADVVMRTWVIMFFISFVPVQLVQTLAGRPNSWTRYRRILFIYIATQVTLYAFAVWSSLSARLPPASGLIVMCECARFSMKMHAYMREKIVHGLRRLVANDGDALPASGEAEAAAAAAAASGADTLAATAHTDATTAPAEGGSTGGSIGDRTPQREIGGGHSAASAAGAARHLAAATLASVVRAGSAGSEGGAQIDAVATSAATPSGNAGEASGAPVSASSMEGSPLARSPLVAPTPMRPAAASESSATTPVQQPGIAMLSPPSAARRGASDGGSGGSAALGESEATPASLLRRRTVAGLAPLAASDGTSHRASNVEESEWTLAPSSGEGSVGGGGGDAGAAPSPFGSVSATAATPGTGASLRSPTTSMASGVTPGGVAGTPRERMGGRGSGGDLGGILVVASPAAGSRRGAAASLPVGRSDSRTIGEPVWVGDGDEIAGGMIDRSPTPTAERLQCPTFVDAVADFADYIPAYAAASGVTLASLRASQPLITISTVNDEIGRYMYFSFSPTLVYRDRYPSNPGPINWIRAGIHTANLAGVIMYTYVITRGILTPLLVPVPPRNPFDIAMLVQTAMLPAVLVFLLSFFGILHSWLNVWGELLRFSDRQFYQQWWTAASWSAYYRRWNKVVGDFLHAYVYNDLQRWGWSRSRAETGVFVISSIVHELIIATSFRFWYPALLLMFGGPGVLFMSLTRRFAARFANVFMWMMLSVGLALLTVLYSREQYARYGYEWASLPGVGEGPPYVYDPMLHPSPGWGWWDWVKYVIVPRSWLEYYHTHNTDAATTHH